MVLSLALSCVKEGDTPAPVTEGQVVHYRAGIQTEMVTRATIGDDLKYQFEEGDKVYLESEDGKLYGVLSMIVDDGIGKNVAYFEGDLKYTGETPLDNPQVNLVLVSKEDELHTVTGGKVNPVTSASYQANKWASSLEEAVSRLSHFTGTGNYKDFKFTLHQQSGFLKCFVRMKSVEAPVGREFTARLLNNAQPFREATVTVSETGAIPFVFAYLGGSVTLDNAELVVEHENSQMASFDVAGSALAANKYYSISRSTLSFDGFKIKARDNNTEVWFNYTYADSGIEYSRDFGETWTQYPSNKPHITLQKGEVICVKGNRENYYNDKLNSQGWWDPQDKPIFRASTGALCYISGNIMSLLSDKVNISESAFEGAFSRGNSNAVNYIDIEADAPLILPATTMALRCYMNMFRNCTSLTRAPQFTVQVTAEKCCYNMFRKCSGLKDVSSIQLPALTLSIDCYRELLRECTSFTGAAPVLPAPVLVQGCYQQMFSKTPLTSVTCLATNISATDCLSQWMSDIKNSGTFYKAPGMTSFPTGVNGILSNWTVVDYSE